MVSFRPGRILGWVTLATLAIFGVLLAGMTWQLRDRLRAEVLRREAEAIHAVALLHLQMAEERYGDLSSEAAFDGVFGAVLESSKLRGVLAVQLFDPSGIVQRGLPVFPESDAANPWWTGVPEIPRSRFLPRGALETALGLAPEPGTGTTRVPLLDIAVPLRTGGAPLGVGRYWIDGAPVAAEFRRMDRRLGWQAGIAFVGGAALVALVLSLAFSRLAEANRRLAAQSADLERANQELDFAAKTGALGAISAHLIHGLKNPLAGLEGFVAETAHGSADGNRGEACRTAIETTRRLRALVSEVTTVLQDETAGPGDYAVPAVEVIDAVRKRALPVADASGIELAVTAEPVAAVSARNAGLAGLVLTNLVANAVEAAPRGTTVGVEVRATGGQVEFVVRDCGAGLPAAVEAALFRPVRSTKRGGGGVGLAISHRLAKHAGGELSLLRTNARGTAFRLVVPAVPLP